ncbi:DNA restriction methylase [Salinisphaera shabanensis T35B1]|uniref:DUF4942 domain-containing protein n=1 Tax=Salinisphaera shabanensis TaxID=180542 RepID=UPI0033411949
MSAVLAGNEEPAFFAPANDDAIDVLIEQYNDALSNMQRVAAFMSGPEMQRAAHFFLDAQRDQFQRQVPEAEKLFKMEIAQKALDAHYWHRALNLTDVLDYMPNAKRHAWNDQIHRRDCPAFEEDTVRDNLRHMLAQRLDFLAEMVEGIFTGLSGEHVTNRPEGFSKRMIISYVYTEYGSTTDRSGLIHDLRAVLAKFMGNDLPRHHGSAAMLYKIRDTTGVWFTLDGGALRIRVYKKGTAHLEVHPDLAWRLNEILAHRHPRAIPPAYRRRPETRQRTTTLINRPIPYPVLRLLESGTYWHYERPPRQANEFSFDWNASRDRKLLAEAKAILEVLGGVPIADSDAYLFDYPANEVIDEVILSGLLPDQRSHQFYPTPPEIAEAVIDAAQIGPNHRCLEPSAGQGGLASFMPQAQTHCVEISPLNCQVLRARGFEATEADFMSWRDGVFDRICMNPPFDRRRARVHLERAASMLAPGGRLVCVLPASYKDKPLLPDMDTSWSRTYRDAFPGVSIDVAILTVQAPG